MMKRNRFLLVAAIGATTAAVAGATVAVAGGSGAPPARPTVGAGTPVARDSLGPNDQAMLARIGATGPVTRIGALNGTAFYEIRGGDGGECFAFGSETEGGLSGGCLGGSGQLTQPIIDMSIIALNPADGTFHFRTIQGIAADGVSAVGVLGADGTVHKTPVVDNVYRMADAAVPTGPITAFVALDASGATIFTRPLSGG
jgi:hypothetical protein